MAFVFSRNCLFLPVSILLFITAESYVPSDTISLGQSLSGNETLVSSGGTFALGFFKPGNSQNYYIGIWYKRRPEKSVVWVANREKPLTNSSSSELKISNDGNLVLISPSNTQIWSSNLSIIPPKSTSAVLLESGNLVLLNESDSSEILWQSFDHPTDSWLPGGRLGWNKLRNEYMALTSWRTPDDPAPGLYSYGVDPKGTNQLVQTWNGTEVYWASGEWNGQYFSAVPEMTRKKVFTYTFIESERYITYTLSDTKIITRLVAETSGVANQWAWLNNSRDWIDAWTQPRLQCQVYSLCGPFSFCDESGVPVCTCLQGFEPASQNNWKSGRWSEGCVRKAQLQCRNATADEKDKFQMMAEVQSPSNPVPLAINSTEECKSACLNNCSCSAYAFYSEVCSIWIGDLRNLRQPSSDNNETRTVYLRLAASELQDSFQSEKTSGVRKGVLIGAIGGSLLVLAVVMLLVWGYQRKRLNEFSRQVKQGSLLLFRYKDLQSFTKNFSERLGGGGFGSVYRGKLPDSTAIAVKKLEGLRQGEKQFRAELSTMGTIQHVNLVRLHGFCSEGAKRLLVYDYMPNGSLDSILFSEKSGQLGWKERYQIALGTARGLAYLHEQCRDCIIHCDIKPENILLDHEFCPKVADFGMAKLMGREISRVLTTMRGTVGYLAPEWLSNLPITPKADVYSFGMVLFELVSGKKNATHSELQRVSFFPLWAALKVAEDDVLCLLDERLGEDADVEELRRVCRVACWCIQDAESHRPSMGQVVQMLEMVAEVSVSPVPNALKYLVDNESSSDFISELP